MSNSSSGVIRRSRRCSVLERFTALLVCMFVMPNSFLADAQTQTDTTSLTIQEFFPGVLDVQGVLAEIIDSQYSVRLGTATWRSVHEAPGESAAGGMAVVRFSVEHPQEKVGVLILVIDSAGSVYSRFREVVPYDLPSDNFLDSEALRTRFLNLQKEYQAVRKHAAQNRAQLEDQRRRARIEASLGQIASLGAQSVSVKSTHKGLPEQALHTEEVLKILTEQLQTSKSPRSFAIREQRIVNHLQELSRVVVAENASGGYRDSEGYTVEEKVRLIEENRSEHIFLLEQELARLANTKGS